MSISDLLKLKFSHLSPFEALRQPIDVLIGADDRQVEALKGLGIHSVFDLATSRVFTAALDIKEGRLPWSDMMASDRVSDDRKNDDPASLKSLDILELDGIGERNRAEILEAVRLSTIRDIALWPPFRGAREILGIAYGSSPREDPDAPSDLLPGSRDYATQLVTHERIVLDDVSGSGRELDEGERVDVLSVDDGSRWFSSIATGARMVFEQTWYPQGVALGDLLYSLPLAPGEITKVAVVDWSRREAVESRERIDERDRLDRQTDQTRDVTEETDATVTETQSGESYTRGMSASQQAGGGVGGVIGAVFGVSASQGTNLTEARTVTSSKGKRNVFARLQQNINQHTRESATAARARRAALVYEVEQSEKEELRTRVVVNYNHSHALSIQYYEVVQIFRTSLRTADVQRLIFIPMEPIDFRRPGVIAKYRSALEKAALTPDHRELLRLAYGHLQVERLSDHPATENEEAARRRAWSTHVQDQGGAVATTTAEKEEWFRDNPGKISRARNEIEDRQRQEADDEERRLGARGIEGNGLGGLFRIPEDYELVWMTATNFGAENMFDKIVVFGQGRDVEEIDFTPLQGNLYEGFAIGPKPLRDVRTITLRLKNTSDLNSDYRTGVFTLRLRTRPSDDSAPIDGSPTSTPFSGRPLDSRMRDELVDVQIPFVMRKGSGRVEIIRVGTTSTSVEAGRELNKYQLHYSSAIYEALSPANIALLIGTLSYRGKRLAEYIDSEPVGVYANYLMFNYYDEDDDWATFARRAQDAAPLEQMVPAPTGGVFAEAVMGRYNASEKIDITRFWDWQDSPIPHHPPEMSPIASGSRATEATTTPGSLSAPIVNLTGVPNLPDPSGLAAALGAVTNGNAFRDMSGLAATSNLAQGALAGSAAGARSAGELSTQNMDIAAQLEAERLKTIRDLAAAYMGVPTGGGGAGEWQSVSSTTAGAAIEHGRKLDERAGSAPGAGGATSGGAARDGDTPGSAERQAYDQWVGTTPKGGGVVLAQHMPVDAEFGGGSTTGGEDRDADYCATYTPSETGLVHVGQVGSDIAGLSVKNWLSPDVMKFLQTTVVCRASSDVTAVVLHETLTPDWSMSRQTSFNADTKTSGGLTYKKGTHFAILSDGTVYQHMDVLQRAAHAGTLNNGHTIGIDIVQEGAPSGSFDTDKTTDDYIGTTIWADKTSGNPTRAYKLPSEAQLKALHTLVDWLIDNTAVTDDHLGINDKNEYVFYFFEDYKTGSKTPGGIYAHGHIGGSGNHVDGHFHALYLWLRRKSKGGQGMTHAAAFSKAKELAAVKRFSTKSGEHKGRPTADLTSVLTAPI